MPAGCVQVDLEPVKMLLCVWALGAGAWLLAIYENGYRVVKLTAMELEAGPFSNHNC